MNNKKIIYFLAPSIFSFGGAQIKAFFIAYYLKKHGYDICVVTEEGARVENFKGFRGKEKNFDIKTIKPFADPKSNIGYLFSWIYRKKHYYRELSKLNLNDYDICLTNNSAAACFFKEKGKKVILLVAFFSLMLKALIGAPRFSIEYTKEIFDYFIRKHIDKKAMRSADIVVAETKKHAVLINKLISRTDIKIIPCAAINKITPGKSNKISTKITCVSMSRLVSQKNIRTIVYQFSKIKNNNVILNIFGKGSQEQSLRSYIKKIKMQDRVFLKGLTYDPYKVFSESDIFLYASKTESFGIVVLEAMSAGLPVVMIDYKYNCSTDLITNDINGIVAKEHEFAKRVEKLLNDRRKMKELGENAKNTASSFTWIDTADKLVELIESV
jgi:glycosyltransferase involved in cell wall biosynthesis